MHQPTDDPIRLGLMPPLTGLVAIYGPEICWAARIAADRINAEGGLLGRWLELIVEDDGSLPESAVPAARRLVEEHRCVALIGNLLSNSRIAVADQVATPGRVPYLNFSFYEGSIASRYFFHFAALPNQQIDRMIPYMAERFGLKMFFAGNNYEWPRGSIDAAKRTLMRLGGDVVGEEYLPIGTRPVEIDELLAQVARSGADVFVPYFAGSDQLSLLTRFTELGLKGHMAVVMGHYDEVMVSHLPPAVREGFYSSNTYFMSVATPANHDYLARLAQLPEVTGIWPQGNGVLTNFGEGTYLCVMAFAAAVRAAGSLDPEALVDALKGVRIEGPQGEVVMDPATHHAEVNGYLARCNADGTFTLVERFGRIPPQIPERYREQFDAILLHESPASPQLAARLAQRKAESMRRLGEARQILSVADMAILATDAQGIITDANPVVARLFGYGEEEMPGLSIHLLLPPHFRKRHAELLHAFVAGEESQRRMSQRGDITGYRKDGSFFPLEASIAKFRNGDEWVLVATLHDLTEVKRAEETLTWRATHDPLTGLPNRALIRERLHNALDRSQRQEGGIALLFVDLDDFKGVNDTHGHEAGDALLRVISERLIGLVRPGDTVGRLAGDEFVVLCEQVEQPASVSSLAERINVALRLPVSHAGATLAVSASIGIAVGHGATHSADDLLRFADTAMYAVKQKGRDGWQFFNETLEEEARRRLTLSGGLRLAVERDELHTLFQPIVRAADGHILGAELLLRWRPPQGEVSPALFIPVAEMNGAIIPIGRWVFEQACRAERRWRERLGADAPYISVNLSTRQLTEPQVVDELLEIVAATGTDPHRLLLEITETSLMADVNASRAILERLSAVGMKIAVDDFGTGYSSLAQLLRLQVHTLKIDREFIDGLDRSSEKQVLVAAICRLGKALGLRLVAEGVETPAERDLVRASGADLIQGFFFYRPLSEEALLDAVIAGLTTGSPAAAVIPLHFLIYASRADEEPDDEALKRLLGQSRAFNRRHGITGYLLHYHGVFLQLLEGPRDTIQGLYARITRDPRHREVSLIAEGPIGQRLFEDWSMGAGGLGDGLLAQRAGLSRDPAELLAWYRQSPGLCCALLEVIGTLV